MAVDDQAGLPDGWVVVTPTATPGAMENGPKAPRTDAAIAMAASGAAVPAARTVMMEAATNPNVPRYMSTLGQITGGIEGAIKGGPMGAAGGAWTGGKAGWFTGKLAQKVGVPIAAALDKVAPYAQAVSTLSGAAGAGDLAQMAEPGRRDIGFLGMGSSEPPAPRQPERFPASMAVNETLATLAERMGRPDLAAKWRAAYNPDATRHREIASEPSRQMNSQLDPDWYRADGSRKGNGFLGVFQRPDGKVSSEISIGVNIGGKEIDIPTLVPTLSKDEVHWLITQDISDPKKIPMSIQQKAIDFAKQRIAAGKSPFAEDGEGR